MRMIDDEVGQKTLDTYTAYIYTYIYIYIYIHIYIYIYIYIYTGIYIYYIKMRPEGLGSVQTKHNELDSQLYVIIGNCRLRNWLVCHSLMSHVTRLNPYTQGHHPPQEVVGDPIPRLVCWSLTSLCHSNGHIETMPAREINPSCTDQDSIPVSQDTMIDEQSLARGHDYASDRSAIGGWRPHSKDSSVCFPHFMPERQRII